MNMKKQVIGIKNSKNPAGIFSNFPLGKNTIIFLGLLLISISFVSATEYAFQLNESTSIDTYIYKGAGTQNYGDSAQMVWNQGAGNEVDRVLMNISPELSTIPANEEIINATLQFYTWQWTSGFDAVFFMNRSFDEGLITWNNCGTGGCDTWRNGSNLYVSDTGGTSNAFFNITLNAGYLEAGLDTFLIIGTAAGDTTIVASSNHSTIAWRPVLYITTEVSDTTPPTYSNFQNNGSTAKINPYINWSINLSDNSNLSFYIFAHNQSGTLANVSNGTIAGTPVFVNQTWTITASKDSYICAQFWFNDTSNNVNQTLLTESGACFTVANTAPPQLTNWIFPSTDPDHDNHNITFNWSAVTDLDGDIVYYAFYLNNTLKQNTTDTTWTADFEADGDYEYYVVTNDEFENGIPSATRYFTLDTKLPAITWNYPSPLNTSISNKDLTLDISCSDENLYQLLVNVTDSLGNETNSTLYETTNETSLTAEHTVALTDEDTYVVKVICFDKHTTKVIPDYGIEIDVLNKKLSYDTGDNIISISLKNSLLNLDDFSTIKLEDRYIFSYDFSSTPADFTIRTFVFVLEAEYPLIYLEKSKYKAHFISNKNWIDFSLDDDKVEYTVSKINDYKYEITILTTKTLLDFNSIGGLNIVEEHAEYKYEITAPYYINNATNGSALTKTQEVVHFNVTWFDSNPSYYIFCFGDGINCVNETPQSYSSGQNITITRTINAVHNQQVKWQFYANDTAGNWNFTPLAFFTIANTAPTITPPSINNSAPYTNDVLKCNNGSFIDADGESATWFYRWFENDVLISGQVSLTLDLSISGLDKGDEIICEIIGSDGADNSTPLNSSSVTIQNFIPTHSEPLLTSSSGTNYTNENLTCYNQSSFDADNDNITPIYNWYKGNEPLNNLYLPFEINADDYSGSGNDGAAYGGSFVGGKVGKGIEFNGSEYISVADSNSLDFINKKTWEIWFKRAATGLETIFDKTNSAQNLTNYKLYFDNSNYLVFAYSIPGTEAGDFSWVTSSEADFNEGSYGSTYFNTTNNAVELSPTKTLGNYTSKIFDATALSSWNTISWTEALPYGEELPNNKGSDSGADMTGNVLLLHLNEVSGTIVDYSGEGNNGTAYGATYSAGGKINTALDFDGANDYISVLSTSGDELDITSDITVSVWIKWKGASDPPDIYYPRIIEKSYQTSYMFSLKPDDATRLSVWLENGERASTATGSLSMNEWHHVAFTFSDSINAIKVYIDGAEKGSGSYTGTISGSNNDLYIGRYPGGTVAYWNGTIDEIAVWNRSLSVDEILNIYKRGALKLNLTVRSCDDAGCSGESFVDITDTPPQDLSVTDNQYFQYRFGFETDNSSYTPKLYNVTVGYAKYDAGVDEVSLSSSSTITDAEWHYAAVSFDNDTLTDNFKMYLDGSLNNYKTDHNTSQYTVNDLYIGRDYQGTSYFSGAVDEFRIYDYALTPEQINNNFLLNYNKIISTETTRTEEYVCSITPNDGSEEGTTLNSSILTIRNYIPSPAPTLIAPANGYTSGALPEFNWTASYDTVDNDDIYYIIQIDNNSDFSSIDYTNNTLSEPRDTSVTLDLTKIDTYYWRVLATDNIGNSSWSSPLRQFTYASSNITFNVTSGEFDVEDLNNVNISSCNYTGFSQSGDTTNPYGPYAFPSGDWQCTFERLNYFDKTQIFTADNDKIVDVVMSLIGALTDEEHTWLEALYNCIILKDCDLYNLLLEMNQTIGNVWQHVKPTDESVITSETQISNTLNSTSNITYEYTVNIPIKAGYSLGAYLPVRIGYWFMNESNESCYSQGTLPEGVTVIEPYCNPLMTQDIGPMGGSIDFRVNLRPNLPTGTYNVKRIIEIDPNDQWEGYGQEVVGRIIVTEDMTHLGIISVKKIRETMPDISIGSPSGSGGGGGSLTIYSPTIYGPTYINKTYIIVEPSDESEEGEERSQEQEREQPKESGMEGITGSVVRNLPKANPVIGIFIIIVIVSSGINVYIYIFKGTNKKKVKKKVKK